jgi:hypothetical protein
MEKAEDATGYWILDARKESNDGRSSRQETGDRMRRERMERRNSGILE